jgi:hypothetical protein
MLIHIKINRQTEFHEYVLQKPGDVLDRMCILSFTV